MIWTVHTFAFLVIFTTDWFSSFLFSGHQWYFVEGTAFAWLILRFIGRRQDNLLRIYEGEKLILGAIVKCLDRSYWTDTVGLLYHFYLAYQYLFLPFGRVLLVSFVIKPSHILKNFLKVISKLKSKGSNSIFGSIDKLLMMMLNFGDKCFSFCCDVAFRMAFVQICDVSLDVVDWKYVEATIEAIYTSIEFTNLFVELN